MPAYEFNLNVDPGGMPPVIHLAQYDTGRTYYANLKQGGEYYYLGLGATAKIKGRNARGVCWELDCTVNTSLTYQVQFTPEGAATDQFGIMPVQMELTAGGEVISTLLMVWDIQRAGYTSEEAVTSPEFETALEEAVAAAIAQQGLGFTEEFKQALLACLNNVAWATPDGQSLVNDLEDALYPEVHLTSITADYEQDRPILDTDSLDLVRLDLVVTANYSDGTSETLADDAYTLTGTLVAPSSTITVGYQGKTDTITVIVTPYIPVEYQRVEWIKPSSFTDQTADNYIETGIVLTTDHGFIARVAAEGSLTRNLFGVRNAQSGNTNTLALSCHSADQKFGFMRFGSQVLTIAYDTNWHTFTCTLDEVSVDDTPFTLAAPASGQSTGTATFRLFTMYRYVNDHYYYQGGAPQKMAYFKILNGSTAVAEYIPCYRKADNVIGVYDRVNSTFIAATGSFDKGSDV